MAKQGDSIILFDGVCSFCNGAVNFIIRHDPAGKFRFAPLQSAAGREAVARRPELANIDSIILMEAGQYYTESDAALRICRHLSGFWKLIYLFIFVPRALRNAVYRLIAERRYQWFGRLDSCMIPTKEIRDRFILDEQ